MMMGGTQHFYAH